MSDAFFRAGIGAVVRDDARRILILKRKNVPDNAWQLPQGGICADELPIDALYRELYEETGLTRKNIEVLRSASEWLVYELPTNYRNAKVGWGQVQRWFLCRLLAPHSTVHPDQTELTEAEWVTSDQLIERAVSFRKPIYRRLIAEFEL